MPAIVAGVLPVWMGLPVGSAAARTEKSRPSGLLETSSPLFARGPLGVVVATGTGEGHKVAPVRNAGNRRRRPAGLDGIAGRVGRRTDGEIKAVRAAGDLERPKRGFKFDDAEVRCRGA